MIKQIASALADSVSERTVRVYIGELEQAGVVKRPGSGNSGGVVLLNSGGMVLLLDYSNHPPLAAGEGKISGKRQPPFDELASLRRLAAYGARHAEAGILCREMAAVLTGSVKRSRRGRLYEQLARLYEQEANLTRETITLLQDISSME